jgi:membrane protease YdiL (CAAX protease family)
MVILWCLAAISCGVAGLHGIFAAPYTADASWTIGGRVGFWLLAAVTAAYFGVGLLPGLVCLVHPRRRPAYTRALAKLSFLLPASVVERRWWVAVSLSAGICEEVIFRGFLLQAVRWQMGMGLTVAWVVSAVVFGFNHLYQGRTGVIQTTVAGLGFGLVAILSGGLALPMALHALVDLQGLVIYRPEMLREMAVAG